MIVRLVESNDTDRATIAICVRFQVVRWLDRVVVGVYLNLEVGKDVNEGCAGGVFGVADASFFRVLTFKGIVFELAHDFKNCIKRLCRHAEEGVLGLEQATASEARFFVHVNLTITDAGQGNRPAGAVGGSDADGSTRVAATGALSNVDL